jgi:AraC family transcriptional regulator of adaptative response / DNA-3-methyladenine glycosylase II
VRAVQSKDARFDGWFYTAVVTTGIYCRPSCPVVPPKPENMRFYPSAAAAQQAGFRACKRCRPDATPGSPEWNERADLVATGDAADRRRGDRRRRRAGLAARLGYSVRQVERQLLAELGAGPLALARAQRAQTARLLIETSALPMADVAFAAGFASIRTFNDTVREVFALSPTELRRRASRGQAGQLAPARCPLRLPFRAAALPGQPVRPSGRDRRARRGGMAGRRLPAHPAAAARARHRGAAPRTRAHRLPAGPHRPAGPGDRDQPVPAAARPGRRPGRGRRPARRRPVLAPLVAKAPGRRVPRTVDAAEFAVRAVLGQQVSTAAARTHAGRLAAAHGEQVDDPAGGLSRLFPSMDVLAGGRPGDAGPAGGAPGQLRRAGRRRWPADRSTSASAATGHEARGGLAALPGVGAWTVETIAMRGLGDPDAFVPGDLGVRAAARPRPSRHPRGAAAACRRLAALALVRGPVPVGDRRARHQPASGRIISRQGSFRDEHKNFGIYAVRRGQSDRAADSRRGRRRPGGRLHGRATAPAAGLHARRAVPGRTGPMPRRWPRRPASWPSTSPGSGPGSSCRWRRAAPASSAASGPRCGTSRTARRSPTASWPAGSAAPQRPGRSGWPTAGTRSRSSCRATGWSALTAA